MTFAVTIAHITVLVRWAVQVAAFTSLSTLADTLSRLTQGIHKACALPRANISFVNRTRNATVFPKESLFALTNSSTFLRLGYARSTLCTSTHTAQRVLVAFQGTVTAHKSFLALALATLKSSRYTFALSTANAIFDILRTRNSAFATEEPLVTLTEGLLLDSVVEALTFP